MMTEEMMRQMPQMMGQGMHPVAQGAMMAATGFAAGRGLLGASLLRNPLVLLAAGVAAGYLIHKYEKEIVQAIVKLTGLGQDFLLHQKEHLSDLVAEAQSVEAQNTEVATPTAGAVPPAEAPQA